MRALLLCIALTLLSALPALSADVLIVQGSHNAAFNEALRGFKSVYSGPTRTIVMSDYAEVDVVRLVREERPKLVLAVGDTALAAARKLRQVPVVALMALSLTREKGPAANICGVGMVAAPERYLKLFKAMGARQVGVVYDPARSGWYLKRAQSAARRLGLELVVREVRNPRDTLSRLEQLKGSVDGLWMLPDLTAVTAETVDAYFLFSLEQHTPLLTFAAAYLTKGATASLDIDRIGAGRQAGEMVLQLLNGSPPEELAVADPARAHLTVNQTVARRLGFNLSNLESEKGE